MSSWDAMANEGIAITHDQFLSSFGQGLIRKNGISALPGVAYWVRQLHEQGCLQAITSVAHPF
jgi:hypothetical protein